MLDLSSIVVSPLPHILIDVHTNRGRLGRGGLGNLLGNTSLGRSEGTTGIGTSFGSLSCNLDLRVRFEQTS